jgi:hypothetical protein
MKYELKKVRYFENRRGQIGHTCHIYEGSREIGESSHDGDCIVYDIRFIESTDEKNFIEWAGTAIKGTRFEEFASDADSDRIQLGMEILLDEHDAKVSA